MIRIQFREPRTPQWIAWKKKCKAARAHLISAKGEDAIDERLYKATSELLFAAYFQKCYFCEGALGVQYKGDVEHFRPKGAVRDANNKEVYIGKGRNRRKHPGYYWLAYDFNNLMPACSFCNVYKRKIGGKGTRFPVMGFRASRPGEEKKEKPVLIHPRENPEKHLDIDLETGTFFARTPRGQQCIELLGLNREGLMAKRREAYRSLCMKIGNRFSNPGNRGAIDETARAVADCRDGRAEFSFVGRKTIAAQKKLAQLL